jgi:adenine-specific DNA-methyltransferase
MTSRYDHLSNEQLIRLLERRDVMQRYGLIWEREGIEQDRARNQDYVVLDLDSTLSTAPQDEAGWRNLVIEGDNWDALRALRLTHAGRIRCILIDPPYNTGNKDFVYNDRFVGKDDRFRHSLWLEFLYQRLVLARDLLAEDGVILVCINDENRARLDMLMELVLPGSRIGTFVWRTRNGSNADQAAYLSVDHEHVLVYGKEAFSFAGGSKSYKGYANTDSDERGDWQAVSMKLAFSYRERPNLYYPLHDPETDIFYPANPDEVWRYASRSRIRSGQRIQTQPVEDFIAQKRILFPDPPRFAVWNTLGELLAAIDAGDVPTSGTTPLLRRGLPDLESWVGRKVGFGTPRRKLFKSELRRATQPLSSVQEVPTTESARDIRAIFGEKSFSFAKPLSLVRFLIQQATEPSDIILDFFAGSATTAHAVLALNAEDEGDRRFIMVSNTEATPEDPDKNLCRDICAERIRRVIAGYGDSPGLGGDFAYLRARRIAEEDVMYDLDPRALWTLLQLRHGHPLRLYDSTCSYQISSPPAESDDQATLILAHAPSDDLFVALRSLPGPLHVFSPTPGQLLDATDRPDLSVEAVPDRLLSEFRRTVAGL